MPKVTASVADAYADFASTVVPAGASATQRREMRRAFYGGALCMFTLLVENARNNSENTAVKKLDEMKAEFDRYADDLKAGRA